MPDTTPIVETPIVDDVPNVFNLDLLTDDFNIESLPASLKSILDRERTKASKTARDKAINDPEVLSKARSLVEKEVTLTTEQKLQKMLEDVQLRENRVEAKSILADLGLNPEETEEVLVALVDKDKDNTVTRVTSYKSMITAMVASQVEKKIKESVDNTPKPKTTPPADSKAFKDMNYEERRALKEKNPSRFNTETKAIKPRI